MKNLRRPMAIACVVILAAVCIAPLIIGIIAPGSALFKGALACMILIPIVMYAFLLILKHVRPQKSTMIDTIVFDVGNVLVSFDWRGHMENLGFDQETIEYLRIHMIQDPLWDETDLGLRPYNEIVDEFCQKNPDYAEPMRQFLMSEEESIIPFGFAVPWLMDLKEKGYKMYILSNWDEHTYDLLKDSILSFRSYMDGCLWSYQEKLIKPDPNFYKLLLNRYKIDPARAVFLDDRIENVNAAKSLGMYGIHVTDHEAAVRGLSALEVR